MMNAQEIIAYIGSAEKRTPVKIYIKERTPLYYGSAQVFGEGPSKVVFGDWRELGPILADNVDHIEDLVIENDRRNSAIPMLDLKGVNARIAQLADSRTVFYIDVNEVVCDQEGNLRDELTFDNLHLLGSKYDIWVSFLKTKGIL